jgi:hypothetical protein
MAFKKISDARADPSVPGSGRVWAGQVTLSSGTYTLDYSADLPGVDGDLDAEPYITATAKAAPDDAGVASAGTSQASISDGSESSTDTVNVLVVEQ